MIYKSALGLDKNKKNNMRMLNYEARGCIFYMNGILEDVVLSCENPFICDNCKAILKKAGCQ